MKRSSLLWLFAFPLLSVFLLPTSSDARTWLVRQDGSGDCVNIQACISLASPGDNILVGPGIYNEHLLIAKPLSLVSELGSSQTAVDVADYGGRCITCSHTSGKVVVEGFTITRGLALGCPPNNFGGGIFCLSGELEVKNCVITSNLGGGVGCGSGSTVSVVGCEMYGNYGEEDWGGCDVFGDCVTGNGATGRVEGCKMWVAGSRGILWYGGQLDARNNEIRNEDSGPHPHSTGMQISSVNLALVQGNFIRVASDGIDADRSTLMMEYNTVVGSGDYGLSIFQCTGSINNNIMASSGGYGLSCLSPGTVVFSCNDVWNNPSGNYEGNCVSPTDISADPLFCDPTSENYHLNCTSPCADAPGCGQIGAFGIACGPTSVTPTTWGKIKVLFR